MPGRPVDALDALGRSDLVRLCAAVELVAFKLIEAAGDRWRCVNGAHLVALVPTGVTFRKIVLVESEAHEGEVAA